MAAIPFGPTAMVLNTWHETTAPLAIAIRQDTSVSLFSCGDIDCPRIEVGDILEPNCIVESDRAMSIGIAPNAIRVPNSEDTLTLTIARQHRNNLSEEAENSFYVGAPGHMTLVDNVDYFGCALFVEFYGGTTGFNPDGMFEDSECGPILGETCMDRILAKAGDWDGNTECLQLAKELELSFGSGSDGSSGCLFPVSSVSIQGIPIIGSGAPAALSREDKEKGNCIPMIPDDYQIGKIGWVQHFALHYTPANTDGFTPIITVIHHHGDRSTSVQMLCIRPLDDYAPLVPGQDSPPPDEDDGEDNDADDGDSETGDDEDNEGDEPGISTGSTISLKSTFVALSLSMLVLYYNTL